MNISKTLMKETTPYLWGYDCKPEDIESFLMHPKAFLERQIEAIEIIEGVMTAHKKRELLQYLAELARVEHGVRELEPWARDHVVHALISFILGIHLNERFLGPLSHVRVDGFQWELAGLLHDVGYPVQIAKEFLLEPFAEKINEITRALGVPASEVGFGIVPKGLTALTNKVNGLDLIQERLNMWNLQINARREYDRMIDSGEICHGIISSLAVLRVIDRIYQKVSPKREYEDIFAEEGGRVNFNQEYFVGDVVSACAAIFIHNLPSRCFSKRRIDRHMAPVGFLLKLSDCLQQWERPSSADPTGFSATKFDIKIEKELSFYADIPEDWKKEMEREISSALVAPDVSIC